MILIRRLLAPMESLLLISIVMLLAACSTTGVASTPSQATTTPAFHSTLKTTDGQFVLQFSVTPNRLGLNNFTVGVEDAANGKPASTMQAQLSTTMLDMDMGTDEISLQSNGHGQYSAQGTLSMAGHWEIHILLRTPDAGLHVASVELDTQP
ncbi:MAG TPA: FixH family protein [Ktedonobacteraceae bacterium]|nr:FixH family protein [Ktedonobacteraceae bacterium]